MSKEHKKRRAKNRKRKPITDVSSAEESLATEVNEKVVLSTETDKTTFDAEQGTSFNEPAQQPACLVPYDESLLDICRTRWQFADWGSLAETEAARILHHPQRGRIALLIAAAHWQLDQAQQAQRFMQMALDSGASQRQAVQLLISGTHQNLAAARLILEQGDDAEAHFLEAMRSGGVPGDSELLAKVRKERMEHEKLGDS